MKEIIKPGKTQKYIHTCTKCGCVFTYNDDDKRMEGHFIKCPYCKSQCKVKDGQEVIFEQESEHSDEKTKLFASNKDVSEIARMQQQIDTFKAALLHINERINNGNKCNLVYTKPLDDNDKHFINNIIKFIDEHEHENHTEPKRQETTVFDIFPQIKQSNAINIVVTTPLDDFTTNPEAELNEYDLDDFAKILAKNRKCGYVTVFPTNKDNAFRKTFIEPNLNEKGFIRQDRFATELTTENGGKYMLFFPWSIINNQNAPYNEK